VKVPRLDDRLEEYVPVRMFPRMRLEIRRLIRQHRYRWPDESAFVRAACNKLILETQEVDVLRKKVRRMSA
jgi:hypothetical protein